MPHHHPRDETLMSFASGTLDEAFALVLSCHLQFCEACRGRVSALEEVGSVFLETFSDAGDEQFIGRAVEKFKREAAGPYLAAAPASRVDAGNDVLMPAPLAKSTGLRRETIPWQHASPGIRSAKAPVSPAAKSALHFLSLDASTEVLRELHSGEHLILVLWGAYDSEDGRFDRGDIHDIAGETIHSFIPLAAEGVTCVVATEATALRDHAWAAP